MGCKYYKNLGYNHIIGKDVFKYVYDDNNMENKDNNCKYFRKKFFAKTEDKIYCKNCKNYYDETECSGEL